MPCSPANCPTAPSPPASTITAVGSIYTNSLRDCRFLDRREEAELSARAKQGDLLARNALIESCLPWASELASRFSAKHHCDFGDAVQAASLGLLEAVSRFDSSKGFRLITYSRCWIIRFMTDMALADHLVRVPKMALNGRGTAKTQEAKERALRPGPLPETLCWPEREEAPFDEDDFQRLRENLEKLPERWRDILLRHAKGEPLSSIGKDYDLTKERVRQIEEQAMGYLRRRLDAENRLLDEVR
ncbi:MAG: sigma-70 family RNA polymerase sigma factor [Patescibacteria group bacterium]|nr:sigma-70 family RNA polymerase sigma factor [Patescibacteria group bacterium]